MKIRLISAGIAGLLGLIAQSPAALAQMPPEVATKWGLIGEWRLDCSAPPSQSNQSLEFIVRDGKLVQDRTDGKLKDAIAIYAAMATPDGALETIEVTPSTPPTVRQIVRRKLGEGRFGVWSNRIVGTEVYGIKDGKLANGSGMAASFIRCRTGAGPVKR